MSLWTVAMMVASADCGECVDGQVTLDGVVQPSLQAALDAAEEGAWIEVCAGTYVGNFVATVPVHLVAVDGPEVTVLDGALTGSVLTLPGGSTVAGFTVTRGSSSTDGGGLRLTSAGETLIEECVFEGNLAPNGGGGAVFAPDGSELMAWDSLFVGNSAAQGGAFLVGDRNITPPSVPGLGVVLDLEDSVVSGNTAAGTLTPLRGGRGGGILAFRATVLEGEVLDNSALNVRSGIVTSLGQGGGIALTGDSLVEETEVIGNLAQGGGGGLHLVNGATVELDDMLIEDNAAELSNGGGVAAAGFSQTMHVFADDTVIRANRALRDAGGVTISGAQNVGGVHWTGGEIVENTASNGGGLFVEGGRHIVAEVEFIGNVASRYGGGAGGRSLSPIFSFYTLAFHDCSFEGNVASTQTGGGLDLGQPTTLTDLEFKDNAARQGGALSLFGWRTLSPNRMPYTLEDIEMKDNTATQSGGGLLVTGNAGVTAEDLEVKDNVAPLAGGINLEDGAITAPDGECKDNDPDDVWVAKISTSYSDLEDFACTNAGCEGEELELNAARIAALSVEPEFVDPGDCYYDFGYGELVPCSLPSR